MGQTIIEKIFQAHSDNEVAPGNIVWLDIDLRSARDFGGPNVAKNFKREYGDAPVADPLKTAFTFDCNAPANNIPYANNQQICRDFAQEKGIRVHDVNSGIGSHVMIDEGLCSTGDIVVGTDSHLNLLGGVGVFGQGMGDQDIAFAFKSGRTWFEVPPTMKVVITGKYRPPVTAKDVTLAVLKRLGSKGALGRSIEFAGQTVEGMNMDERITLASMVTEMGGIIGFIPPDEEVRRYLRERSGRETFSDLAADEDAKYVETVEIDVSGIKPLIACPPSPSNIVEVGEVAGKKIHSVFLGSCTNGRITDIEAAAGLLKGKEIHPAVMMKVVPATRKIWGMMLEKGLIGSFFSAGAIISHPGCGGCASGQLGMTGEGEVQVSTSNRNFPGKQGSGETYIASPLTAVASAIKGEIATPRE